MMVDAAPHSEVQHICCNQRGHLDVPSAQRKCTKKTGKEGKEENGFDPKAFLDHLISQGAGGCNGVRAVIERV